MYYMQKDGQAIPQFNGADFLKVAERVEAAGFSASAVVKGNGCIIVKQKERTPGAIKAIVIFSSFSDGVFVLKVNKFPADTVADAKVVAAIAFRYVLQTAPELKGKIKVETNF